MECCLVFVMNICQVIVCCQEVLVECIVYINDLLCMWIGIVQECQNCQILEFMNVCVVQQLKLQQVVEGLLVVVILYYVIGLLGYVGKVVKVVGLFINLDLVIGLVVLVVVVCVWLGLCCMYKDLGNY